MDAISRISSPVTESWVAWVLLLLLFLGIINGMFVQELKLVFYGLFSRAERTYASNNTTQANIFAILFKVGVLGLLSFLFLWSDGIAFEIANYGIVCGVFLGVYCLQWICVNFLGSIFLTRQEKENAILHRNMIYGAMCALMFPIVMLLLWEVNSFTIAMVILLATIYLVMLLVKWIQLFYNGILSILYVLLYIISLEVLPLAGAFLLIKNML